MLTHTRVGSEKVELENWSFNTSNSDTLDVKAKVNFTYYYLPFDFDLSVPCGHDTKELVAHIPVKPEIVPAGKIHNVYPFFAFERGLTTALADNDERVCSIKVFKSPETNRRFAIHSSGMPIYGKPYLGESPGNNVFSNWRGFYHKKLSLEYHPDDSHFLAQPFIYSDEDIGMTLLLPLYNENGLLYCVRPYIDTISFWKLWASENRIKTAGMKIYRSALTPLTICLDLVTCPIQLAWFYYQMKHFLQ